MQDYKTPDAKVLKARTYTLFTNGPFGVTHSIIEDASSWLRVKLRLETAGPVAVGTNPDLGVVLGGHGALLGADEMEVVLKKNDDLYYVSNATNRVRVIIEAIPWQEQILITLSDTVKTLLSLRKDPKKPPPTGRKPGPNFGNIGGRRW